MNISKAITIAKVKIRHHLYFFCSIFGLISSRKSVCRELRKKQHPLTELSGVLYIPGSILRLCLQRIDLRSGTVQKNFFKGNGHGHSVICGKNGRGWLVPENGFSIIEFDLQTLRETNRITSGRSLIGGHGSCSADGSRLYFVDRGICDKTLESNLVVYDTDRRKIIHKYEGVGIYPHDVKITIGEQKAIVASYGRITAFVGTVPSTGYSKKSMCLRRPSFAIVDLQKHVIESKCTFKENFLLAHVALDQKEGFAFIEGTGYLQMSECSEESLSLITRGRNLNITAEEMIKRIVYTSGVILRVDIENAKVLNRFDHSFPRPQSIRFSERTGRVYETFAYRNTVSILDKETLDIKKQYNFPGLGFVDPRGLALSADERFLFVSGRSKNIYCLDMHSQGEIKCQVICTSNNLNSHITIFSG